MLFVDVTLAKNVPHHLLGKFFGLSSFAAMIGALLGNSLFGWLLSLIKTKNDYTHFWFSIAITAAVVMMFFIVSDIYLQKKGVQTVAKLNN